MESRKKALTYTFIYASAILILISWLVSFLKNKEVVNFGFDIESASLITLGVISLIILSLIKDSFYFAAFLAIVPFAFARSFDLVTMPKTVYITASLALVGIIVHIIRFREKIKLGSYFFSLLIFCVGMMLGGLINSDAFKDSFLASFAISALIMFVYIFIVTYLKKPSFNAICHLMIAIAIVLIAQTFLYQIIIHTHNFFLAKDAQYGWGCTNNLALILLFTFPFSIYFMIKAKTITAVFSSLFLLLQTLTIFLNYSRGAIFVMFVMVPVCVVYAFIKSKNRVLLSSYFVLNLICLIALFIVLNIVNEELYKSIFENAFKFNLDTLNGRRSIYETMLNASKDHILFGKGLLSTMNSSLYTVNPDVLKDNAYLWGHNTFIHTLYISGMFGLLSMCLHLFFKYKLLLKKASVKTMIVLFAYFASGMYGLMDISYYYVIYMIPMIILMALLEFEISKKEEDENEA